MLPKVGKPGGRECKVLHIPQVRAVAREPDSLCWVHGTLQIPPLRRVRGAQGGLHLACRHGGARNAVVHRETWVPPDMPKPVASTTDVLLHGLRCLPAVEAAVMTESAVRQGVTTLPYLRERLPGNRNGAARKVLELVDGTADSAIEVVARLLFRSEGIYTETQVDLPGIGIVDFLLEGFLIVEIDGATHLEPRQVKKDRRRNNAGTLRGYTVLRYGYAEVVYHPEQIIEEVWQVLRGRVVR